MQILHELFEESFNENRRNLWSSGDTENDLTRSYIAARSSLDRTLSDEQKRLFKAFIKATEDLYENEEYIAFKDGFSLALKLIYETIAN